MVGVTGREVISQSGGTRKIQRISGLDPAFPGFFPQLLSPAKYLSKDDAVFVDIIHTDAGLYGAPIGTGNVDFWPNDGHTLQPGCPTRNFQLLSDNDLCSHRRSWRFWAESVTLPVINTFEAVPATSWSAFKRHKVDESKVVTMGLDCPSNATDNYYLQTNGESPFAKGAAGIVYTG